MQLRIERQLVQFARQGEMAPKYVTLTQHVDPAIVKEAAIQAILASTPSRVKQRQAFEQLHAAWGVKFEANDIIPLDNVIATNP